jgi:hypothetical protein
VECKGLGVEVACVLKEEQMHLHPTYLIPLIQQTWDFIMPGYFMRQLRKLQLLEQQNQINVQQYFGSPLLLLIKTVLQQLAILMMTSENMLLLLLKASQIEISLS